MEQKNLNKTIDSKSIILISKKKFNEICKLLKEQRKLDNKFVNLLESRFKDSNIIPILNNNYLLVIDKLLNKIFNDTHKDEFGDTLWTWFVYENDLGKNKYEITLDEKEYIISSPSKFYNFMIKWLNKKNKKLKFKEELKPIISKKTFIEICNLIKKQKEKDDELIEFINIYFNTCSYSLPQSNNLLLIIEKIMNSIFYDTESEDENEDTLWSWFAYENEFGENRYKITLDGNDYEISSPNDFYDFILKVLKSKEKELSY